MKSVFWAKKTLVSAVLVVATALLLSALPADAGPSVLVGEVTTDLGQPLSKDTLMQFGDSAGHTMDLMLKTPGVYKVDTTALTPPVWIKAGNLFAVSLTGKGVQEVTPVSYAILNQILQTQGTNAAAQFGTLSPIPVTSVQVQAVSSMFKDSLQYPLSSFKVNFAKFDFNTARFHFNSGFGKFLDNTTFSGAGTATQTFQTSFGSGISQTSTYHAMMGGTWTQWMTTAGIAVSGSFDYTKVLTAANAVRDYGNVGNFLKTQWFPTFKKEGKFVDSTNVLPLLDTNYLSNGFDRNTQASRYATDFRTLKFSPTFDLGVIRSYKTSNPDSNHNLIGVDYTFTKTDFGVKLPERISEIFKCDSTSCIPYGNQQLGGTEVRLRWDTYSINPSPPLSFGTLRTSFLTPKNTYTSIRVSDFNNTFFNNSLMDGPFPETLNLQPTHGGPIVPFLKDQFSLSASVLPPPFVYNDFFTFDGNLNPSGSTNYIRFAGGYSNETVNWRKPFLDGSHQLNDFHLPATISVKYDFALTYPLFRSRLDGTACSSAGTLKLDSVRKVIPLNAKSASIKIPKDVSGQPTDGFILQLHLEGPFGQSSALQYVVGGGCSPG
jgi:hypothetical protein